VPTDDSPSPPTVPLEITPQQIGRYRILERLGAGGMGAVYRAHDPQLDRVVAIKVPLFDVPRSQLAQRIQRFQREARAAAQIWHPRVCPIYDVGEHEGQPYVVMAYVEGRSLATRLAAGRFEDAAEAVTLTLQLLDALDTVHARGIIHRDLKPGNVMRDAAGRAILMDFGLARPEQQSAEHLTSDGVVLGTPSYMAPEQAAGQAERVGPWTDLYSLGVVLYQMLTGRLPFEGPPLTVLAKIVHEAPPPPHSLRPDLDPALEAIMLRALAKEYEARYQSAREFAQALQGWLRSAAAKITLPAEAGGEKAGADPTLPVTAAGPAQFLPSPWNAFRQWCLAVAVIQTIPTGMMLLMVVIANLTDSEVPKGMRIPGYLTTVLFLLFGAGLVCWLLWELLGGRRHAQRSLLEAVETGQNEGVLHFLIYQGADVEGRDEMGETALMKAARKGYIETIKLLLTHGAKVNAKNAAGETALSLALRAGRKDIAEVLRRSGAWD
jgi:hypothetical protein